MINIYIEIIILDSGERNKSNKVGNGFGIWQPRLTLAKVARERRLRSGDLQAENIYEKEEGPAYIWGNDGFQVEGMVHAGWSMNDAGKGVRQKGAEWESRPEDR